MSETRHTRLRALLLGVFVAASGLALFIYQSLPANYVWLAYFYPGSDSNLRGYPVVYPPSSYTGTWTDYAFTGRPLATMNYVNGEIYGKQIYYRDDGTPYLIRYIGHEGWERDEISLGPPPRTEIPWFFPQRWVNRSLDRLAFLNKIFPEPPAVLISEEPSEKEAIREKASK
jgi:hypothetical protein